MPPDPMTDDSTDPPRETRIGLVAEAFHTFHEGAGHELGEAIAVPFEDCVEEIERTRYQQH